MWRLNQYDAEDAIDRLVDLSLATRQAYGFRNFENYRLRVKVLCG